MQQVWHQSDSIGSRFHQGSKLGTFIYIFGIPMKKLLLALVFAGLGATSAMTADLAARPYSKAPALLAPTSAYKIGRAHV